MLLVVLIEISWRAEGLLWAMAVKRIAVLFTIATALLSLSFSPPSSVDAHPLVTCGFNQIYQLGDSISDAGNLIRESELGANSAFAQAPYGENFIDHEATGRCSNGLLIIDYLALASGLPFLPPIKDTTADFNHGANFAVAGATAMSTTVLGRKGIVDPVTNSSLDVQLKWMKNHFESFCRDGACPAALENALFMVGTIGGNDYNYAFFSHKNMEALQALVPQVVHTIKNAVKRVISFGGRRIVVPGNFPIGCLPIYLTGFQTENPDDYDEHHCLTGLNDFAKYHNQLLQEAIDELQQEYPDVIIVYGDYYNAYKHALELAEANGFDTQRACCGTGGAYNFSPRQMCGYPGTTVCPDPSRYMSFDGIHSTQETYHRMTDWLLGDLFWKLQCV